MKENSPSCAVCGTPITDKLRGNCPVCLLGLATPEFPKTAASQPSPSLTVQAQQRLGDYELLEELARGGMGAVFRARQISLKRIVAVKVLLGAQFSNDAARKRFQREAE